MIAGLTCRRATRDEHVSALRLAVTPGAMPALERDRHTAAFIRYAEPMNWPLDCVWVVSLGKRLIWSCVAIPSPGRSAMLITSYPPRIEADAIAPVFLQIDTTLRQQGIRLVQLLLRENDAITTQSAHAAGFESIATLQYMKLDMSRADITPAPSDAVTGLHWQPYSKSNHNLFRKVIAASYQGSLDCVALAGRRDIEDVIAGHKAAGEFDERHWWLLSDAQHLLGCILLARLPQQAKMELVYVGVSPDARGRGLGRLLVNKALETTRKSRSNTLTLAVDSTNSPALRLYEAVGFQTCERRAALIRIIS